MTQLLSDYIFMIETRILIVNLNLIYIRFIPSYYEQNFNITGSIRHKLS